MSENPIVLFRHTLDKQAVEFQKVLPAHIDPARFIRVAISAVRKNPALLDCDRSTLLSACMDAAEDGLIPDGYEAALIVRKGKACYDPMYQGLLKLARSPGNVHIPGAHVVYDNDHFKYWLDDSGEHLEWQPVFRGDRGLPYLSFAVATTTSGERYIQIILEKEIQAIRRISTARNGPWDGPAVDEMRKKTVLKRLCKMLPHYSSSEDSDRYDRDESLALEMEEEPKALEVQSKKPQKTLELLQEYEALTFDGEPIVEESIEETENGQA